MLQANPTLKTNYGINTSQEDPARRGMFLSFHLSSEPFPRAPPEHPSVQRAQPSPIPPEQAHLSLVFLAGSSHSLTLSTTALCLFNEPVTITTLGLSAWLLCLGKNTRGKDSSPFLCEISQL